MARDEYTTISVPNDTYERLAERKGDRTWGELFADLLEATDPSPPEPDVTGPDRVREVLERLDEQRRTMERLEDTVDKTPERVADDLENRFR